MIVSASRRTDIPAFYSEWFFNRIREEYVLVRNPMNIHQIGRINLSSNVVDGIVLWTKNPIPMMNRLAELDKYIYYFQFTLNPYDSDVEPNIPSKDEVIIPTFQTLSKAVGRDRVVWRYDPIFFNEKYNMKYHCEKFRSFASKLAGYTEKCTISFLDLYKNTERNMKPLAIRKETYEMQSELVLYFSKVAKEYGLFIDTCAEINDYEDSDISHSCCVDKKLFERLGNCKLTIEKDSNQRTECGCCTSIDIGAYNTCRHGCLYCYANYSSKIVSNNVLKHDPCSPLLFGTLDKKDIVRDRVMQSCKDNQLSLFDI